MTSTAKKPIDVNIVEHETETLARLGLATRADFLALRRLVTYHKRGEELAHVFGAEEDFERWERLLQSVGL